MNIFANNFEISYFAIPTVLVKELLLAFPIINNTNLDPITSWPYLVPCNAYIDPDQFIELKFINVTIKVPFPQLVSPSIGNNTCGLYLIPIDVLLMGENRIPQGTSFFFGEPFVRYIICFSFQIFTGAKNNGG